MSCGSVAPGCSKATKSSCPFRFPKLQHYYTLIFKAKRRVKCLANCPHKAQNPLNDSLPSKRRIACKIGLESISILCCFESAWRIRPWISVLSIPDHDVPLLFGLLCDESFPLKKMLSGPVAGELPLITSRRTTLFLPSDVV